MWAYESVFYQIYPLGMCGAPFENDGVQEHRILQVLDWIPHLQKLGIGAVYFSPLWESDTHGYNTRDYRKVDVRLGTNADFKKVCKALHAAGIRVVIDGVFNHVGRGFGPFQDVLEKKWDSRYKDWFYLSFDGNSCYNDGLWYEGWEGNFDLVKINLQHPDVRRYLLDSVKFWIDEFGIDGLRLDVAYMVDRDFLKALRYETSQWKEDFFLLGEILGGDYKQIMNDEMCHSVTNYECYKGIHSSITSRNLFEILHSLMRQFGPEQWCLYRGYHLLSFVDNHDVSRIASILKDPALVRIAYAIMFGMPGIPQVYYGSEWGYAADKSQGDPALRPAFAAPEWNELTDYVASLAKAWSTSPALQYGDIRSVVLENTHCIFERFLDENQRVLIAVNLDDGEYTFHFDARAGRAHDLTGGDDVDFGGGLTLPGKTAKVLAPF
ncbi:MAG: cyclomaltodextrinase [Lachnospiraceae bacterium]|nr:cyclomaltodextrinase [Lachnospiraceae bacterium]